LGILEETLKDELLHAAKLDRKHRGELAELAFMRKAATLGFAVAKPWGDCDRYDVIVRIGKVFWRVQIKSVWSKASGRPHFRVRTTGNHKSLYSRDDVDFLVAYLFPESIWYVFPVELIENRSAVHLRPGLKTSSFEPYREAWNLMRPPQTEVTIAEPVVKAVIDANRAAASDSGSAS
jgi:hypothetical protein